MRNRVLFGIAAMALALTSIACAAVHDTTSALTGTTLGERCGAYRAGNAAAVVMGLTGEEEAVAAAILAASCPAAP